MQTYSNKQLELIQLWRSGKLKRINILTGSVRSGKTWVSLVLFALWVWSMPADRSYLMVAKTLTSLRRNCLDLLQTLVGNNNFTYSLPAKEARLFGRLVYLEGANDARAESKIRGMTLQGAYVDELTLITEDFFAMLLSRLSDAGAKLFATTNPDAPNHWVKVNYLDRENELDLFSMHFLIDDNPFLDTAYVESLKREFTGVFYARYVMGEWARAEGVIYTLFAENPEPFIIGRPPPEIIPSFYEAPKPSIIHVNIGVDFGGNKSATTFVATGFTRSFKEVIVLDEEHRPAASENPDTLAAAFVDFCKKIKTQYPQTQYAYADSAEQILIRGLRVAVAKSGVPIQIINARKDEIINRIRLVNALMGQGRYKIMHHCRHLIGALRVAVWDEKKQEDTRLDDGSYCVDILDAMEYTVEPMARYLQMMA